MMLRLAMCQLASRGRDQEASLAAADAACRTAAAAGADLALLPEMWSVGYDLPDPADAAAVAAFRALACRADGPYRRHFGALAAELSMAVGLGHLEATAGPPRNSLALFDRHGRLALEYAKVHTCDFDQERQLTRGDGFPVADLDTAAGPVRVGAMICYDHEFPESARLLMLAGAELILVPNACELERNRLMQLHARAYENMVAIAVCNYAGGPFRGGSVVLDGMAFAADESSRDMTLGQAGDGDTLLLADLDLAALRAYRRRETWGNAFRRPALYSALSDESVREPFRRPERRPG